ncbi:MAG: efflux RND transporter periplasmic adaptor subunit [Spirochaetales bacterium]|nr:efflux RND transporter periplasmic adaptor subunit [Spirochaetales bacterium]
MSKNKMKRVILVLAGTIAIVAAAQLVKAFQKEPEIELPVRPVKVMTLEKNAGSFTRNYPGVVKSSQIVELTFEVNGRISEMPVGEGERVQQGDLIARLDPTDYLNRRDAAKAQYDTAKSNLDRSISLYERDMISQVELETRQATFDVNMADYNIAQKALNDTYIYAPFDGVISARYVDLFEQVQSQQPIMTLEDLRKIDVTVNVPETTVRHFNKYNINVFATFEENSDTQYALTVKEFSSAPDPQTKTYRVTLTMDRPEGISIFPGMAVKVVIDGKLKGGTPEDVYIIPLAALFSNPAGDTLVWVVNEQDMTVQSRKVETRTLSDGFVEVTSGLEDGEVIAIAGVSQLMEDQEIRYYNQ